MIIIMPTATHETQQTQTAETGASYTPEQIERARGALQADHVDILREAIFTKRLGAHEAIFDQQDGLTLDELEYKQDEADQQIVSDNTNIYLAHHDIDESDDIAEPLRNILQRYTPIAMTEDQWQYGPLSDDGERDVSRSGRQLLQQETDQLFGGTTDETGVPTPESPDPSVELEARLVDMRKRVAELSVQRRSRLTRRSSRKSRRLADEYRNAFEEYGAAYTALGEYQVEQLRADPDVGDEVIAQAVIIGTIAERRAFTEAEAEVLEEDNSFKNRIARLYAKRSGMVAANIAIGLPVGFAASKLAKYGAIAAVPVAGVAAIASIRAAKSIFTATIGSRARLHSDFTKRQDTDIQLLSERFNTPEGQVPIGANISTARYARGSEEFLVDSIHGRVHRDIKGNKTRAVVSAAVAGSAAVVGAIAADHIHWPSGGPGTKTPDEVLREAGVDDAAARQRIIDNPEAFQRMVDNPEQFAQFQQSVDTIREKTGLAGDALEERVRGTLRLAEHLENSPNPPVGDAVSTDIGEFAVSPETYTIPQGGGIIRDVIRPTALAEGHTLTPAQETQIWQTLRTRFDNNLFTDSPVASRGADQWILRPGQGTLRPEVARYLKEQIALVQR